MTSATEAFVGKLMADTAGAGAAIFAAVGDRLGLWKDLAAHGAATSEGLAARTALSPRHVREWLGAMTTAGYLGYEPGARTFALPAEHAPALVEEAGPVFFGGVLETGEPGVARQHLALLDGKPDTQVSILAGVISETVAGLHGAELARAVGLGGRGRRLGAAAERARVNVQRRIADAVRRIAEQAPGLGRHLGRTIRTGVYCAYLPDRDGNGG